VAEEGDRLTRCAALLQQCRDALGNCRRWVGRRRGQFEMPRLAGRFIGRDQIGESAADIDADPDHSGKRGVCFISRRVRAPL